MSTGADLRGGLFTGFANQTGRESGRWWATRRWWTNAAVWSAFVNGLLALLLWVVPGLEGGGEVASMQLDEVAVQFTGLAAALAAAGVVLVAQGVLLDDRRDGLLEWLLSKPLSRPALIAAKFAGHAPALVFVAVVVPWLGVYGQMSAALGAPWPQGRWAAATALIAVLVAFQLSFVLLLSTVTTSRSVVLAVPLVALVGSDAVVAFVPALAEWLPWGLGRIAGLALLEGSLASTQLVVVTGALTAGCIVAAAWRFERDEL